MSNAPGGIKATRACYIAQRNSVGITMSTSIRNSSHPALSGVDGLATSTSDIVLLIGGLALIFGFATRYAAVVMTIFMLVATFSSHRYWDFSDAAVRRAQDSNFYKNMAILGGIFFLFVCGAGRFSLDAWLRKRS